MRYDKVRKYSTTGRRKSRAEIIDSYYSKYKYKCECSHTQLIPYNLNKVRCDYCGRWIYKSKRSEFKDKLSSIMGRRFE